MNLEKLSRSPDPLFATDTTKFRDRRMHNVEAVELVSLGSSKAQETGELAEKLQALRSDLSEARKDLSFLQKNHPKARHLIFQKQDKVTQLEKQIKNVTAELQELKRR